MSRELEVLEQSGLNDAHRRRIAALTGGMRKLIDELQRAGVEDKQTVELQRRIAALEQATGAEPSEPDHVVDAVLAQLWVLGCELRPRHLRGYGEIDERGRALLEEHAESIGEGVERLRRALRVDG